MVWTSDYKYQLPNLFFALINFKTLLVIEIIFLMIICEDMSYWNQKENIFSRSNITILLSIQSFQAEQ